MYGLVNSAIILCICYCILHLLYSKTLYYKQTKNPLISIMFNKGRLGEFYTYIALEEMDGYKKYLFNLYVPKDNGETTEIDIVFLHESGVYVIESKNYSGWIFGSENQKVWTQTLPKGRGRSQKEHFYNPIMQNELHIKWLKKYINKESIPMFSYIVFSNRCELKRISFTSEDHLVIKRNCLLRKVQINSLISKQRMTTEQIDEIYEKLYKLTQTSDVTKKQHIQRIRNKYKEHTVPEENSVHEICPRCGATLVLRTASKGNHQGQQFWGCSRFPKCRYIKK